MKFSLPKVTLVDAITSVSAAASSDGPTSGIQIEAHEIDQLVHVRAVSSEMAMATKVPGTVEADGIAMVSARVLSSLARVARGAEVDCELIGGELHFGGKGAGLVCRTMADSSFPYPSVAAPADFASVDGKAFKRAVSMATACAVKNLPMAYSGLRLQSKDGEVTVVGCDGSRAVRVVVGESEIPFEGILPQRAATVAGKLAAGHDELVLSGDINRIGFRSGETVLRAVQMAGTYPEVERIIPQEAETTVKVSSPEILGLVSRIRAVAKMGATDLVQIELTTGEKAVTISCNGGAGRVHETIEAEVTGPLVVGLKMKWNFFADAVSFMDVEEDAVLGFIGERDNALFVKQANWRYMAMPIGTPRARTAT